jgi:NAD(P)-dependent dehydrogenase (short-subunit alcohol dehydrogenase family)
MAYEQFSLLGKTALVTGAGGLLGLEHCAALLESGAQVVLCDINQKALDIAQSRLSQTYDPLQIRTSIVDVSNYVSVCTAAESLEKKNIRIDILVNNAAIDPKVNGTAGLLETSRLENFSEQQWSLELAVGLTGAFFCSKVFGTRMAADTKGGVILNIASDLSVISPDQRLYKKNNTSTQNQPVKPVTYSVIKSGLIGLTKYLSTYWVDCNVRCNALSPGGVLHQQSDDFVERISTLIPLGRMAQPNEYRAAVQFLCSDASSYMNGQNLVIDGGRSVW